MAKTIVTVLSSFGFGLGVVLLMKLRAASSSNALNIDRSTRAARLKEGLRIINASLAGGIVGGVLIAGFGGRLLMRVIAATSDSRAQGRLTDAREVVGDVSAGGSFFLIVFVGVFGGSIGAMAYSLLRPVLPQPGAVAGLLIAGVVGGILARPSDLLNPDSIDFQILGPKWLAVLMVITLIALFGATSGALIDTFVRIWPQPAWTWRGVAGLIPLIILVLPSPLAVGAIVIVGVRGWRRPAALGRTGRSFAAILVAAGVAGWLWTFATAVQIVF